MSANHSITNVLSPNSISRISLICRLERFISCKLQGSRSAWFGADIRPHSQCKIVSFFPNLDPKFSQFRPQVFPIWLLEKKIGKVEKKCHATLQKCRGQNTWFLTALRLCMQDTWKEVYGYQYMSCFFVFFPNFKENTAIFPNSKGPGPQSQKGVWEPWNYLPKCIVLGERLNKCIFW